MLRAMHFGPLVVPGSDGNRSSGIVARNNGGLHRDRRFDDEPSARIVLAPGFLKMVYIRSQRMGESSRVLFSITHVQIASRPERATR